MDSLARVAISPLISRHNISQTFLGGYIYYPEKTYRRGAALIHIGSLKYAQAAYQHSNVPNSRYTL